MAIVCMNRSPQLNASSSSFLLNESWEFTGEKWNNDTSANPAYDEGENCGGELEKSDVEHDVSVGESGGVTYVRENMT